jgi:hypothetical protein
MFFSPCAPDVKARKLRRRSAAQHLHAGLHLNVAAGPVLAPAMQGDWCCSAALSMLTSYAKVRMAKRHPKLGARPHCLPCPRVCHLCSIPC